MSEYEVQLSVDLFKLAPGVGSALKPVQDALTACGAGRLGIRSRVCTVTMTGKHTLTGKECAIVKRSVAEAFQERFPQYDFRVDSIRKKSRNSRSQSHSR